MLVGNQWALKVNFYGRENQITTCGCVCDRKR